MTSLCDSMASLSDSMTCSCNNTHSATYRPPKQINSTLVGRSCEGLLALLGRKVIIMY